MPPTGFESITIEGFKSIQSIQNLRLRPINILIGANGSGKSNFLEAFVFLDEAMNGRKEKYVQENGGADKLLHFGSGETESILIGYLAQSGYSLFAGFEYRQGDRLDPQDDSLAGTAVPGGFSYQEAPTWRKYDFVDTKRHSPFKKTNEIHDNRFLRSDGANLAAFLYLLKARYGSSYELVRRTVQLVAPFFEDFQLTPLALNPDTIKLEWKHKNSDGYFSASTFSDGTLRFIALATLFLQPVELRPAVILIDEPELGLHPVAITLLASLIRQASVDTQVIVATQSPRLVDYFDPEDILVANRIHGATTIERLASEPLTEWLDEYSLGELWEKNEFAGRPMRE